MEEKQRVIISRLVTGCLLIFLLNRFLAHALISGLGSPVITDVEMDITYWYFQWSGIPFFIVTHHDIALAYDVLLLAFGILSFLYPIRLYFMIPFALLLSGYALMFNLFATHHHAAVSILIIILIPFCLKGTGNFFLGWEGTRYYLCLIFFMAFCWKLLPNGSFYQANHGIISFESNLGEYIYHNPETLLSSFYKFLIRHSWVLNAGDKLIFILEGLMVVGLFSKKYDRILIFIPLLIHVSTYLFADVFFFEFLLLDLAFLNKKQIDIIGNFIPPIAILKQNSPPTSA